MFFLYKPNISLRFSKGLVLPYCDGPTNSSNPAENIYMKIISSAKKYIYITTPYLILDTDFINILTLSAKSGVDVRILTPFIPDKKIVQSLSRSFYILLIPYGVKVYEYTPGFIHGKTIVADDNVCMVGTVNLDFRSLAWNYECGTYIYNSDTVLDVRNDFLETIKVSEEIVLIKETFPRKVLNAFLRLLTPLM